MLLSWTINLPQKCTWIMFYLVVLWCYKNKYLAVICFVWSAVWMMMVSCCLPCHYVFCSNFGMLMNHVAVAAIPCCCDDDVDVHKILLQFWDMNVCLLCCYVLLFWNMMMMYTMLSFVLVCCLNDDDEHHCYMLLLVLIDDETWWWIPMLLKPAAVFETLGVLLRNPCKSC